MTLKARYRNFIFIPSTNCFFCFFFFCFCFFSTIKYLLFSYSFRKLCLVGPGGVLLMRMRLRSTYQNRISENHFSGKYIRFKGGVCGGGGGIYIYI